MHYEFERAEHIDDYLKAIKGADEFFVKEDPENGIAIINYMFNTPLTFPDTRGLEGEELRNAILRRDCRGIKFDLESGDIVTKPLHKFFNVAERPETQINEIDWEQPHHILEKLDGSMITLFDGKAHTKMGATDVALPVNNYLHENPQYLDFHFDCWKSGATAIFEWCSRQQRIIIDYPKEELVLTAIRFKYTGNYVDYDYMAKCALKFNVPVVRALPGAVQNITEFVETTKAIEDAEGYVVRFNTGHMCKIKADWYCRIHNTKELFFYEKNVWHLVLSGELDDAKPFMGDSEKALVEEFAHELDSRLTKKAHELAQFVLRNQWKDKKTFALEVVPQLPKFEKSIAFRLYDQYPNANAREMLRKTLLENCRAQGSVDAIRFLVGGLSWSDFYN